MHVDTQSVEIQIANEKLKKLKGMNSTDIDSLFESIHDAIESSLFTDDEEQSGAPMGLELNVDLKGNKLVIKRQPEIPRPPVLPPEEKPAEP